MIMSDAHFHIHVYMYTGADLENFSRGGPILSKKKPITQTQKILNTSYLIVILWMDSV